MAKKSDLVAVSAAPTTGLLVSMCIREDHAFAAPAQAIGALRLGLTDEQRRERLDVMRTAHAMAVATGEPADAGAVLLPMRPSGEALAAMCAVLGTTLESIARKVYEEIVGDGFYSADREASYAAVMEPASPTLAPVPRRGGRAAEGG